MFNEIKEKKSYKNFDDLKNCKEFDVEYSRINNVKSIHCSYDHENEEYIVIVIKDGRE